MVTGSLVVPELLVVELELLAETGSLLVRPADELTSPVSPTLPAPTTLRAHAVAAHITNRALLSAVNQRRRDTCGTDCIVMPSRRTTGRSGCNDRPVLLDASNQR